VATDTKALENDEVHVDPDNQGDAELGDADGDGHQDGGPKPPMPEIDVVRQLAEKAGWKPKEQWKGEGWTDASEFLAHQLEKGERSTKRLQQVGAQLRTLEGQTKAQRKAALDAELDAAVEAGDIEAARRISNEKAVVDEPPAVADFRARNDWFGVDKRASALVKALDSEFAAEGPITDARAHMKRIEEEVYATFPHLSPEPPPAQTTQQRRQAPHTARTSGAMRNDGGKKTEANLTSEEVSAFNQLKAHGMVKDRKTYAAQLNDAKERENA